MTEKVLITAALPYANGALHFGHIAGAYLPADCYARFERLLGKDVHYVCGSDEYGVAVTMSAELAGRTPKEQVDYFHAVNKGLFEQLNFTFDHYSRTSWKGHDKPVQQFFLDLLEAGYIEDRVTEQLYSEQEGRFLADRYVVGICPSCGYEKARGDECPKCAASYDATDLKNPRSKCSGAQLQLRQTKHWFLRLDLFKDQLTNWLACKNWKPNVVNFVKSYIDNLHARPITRDLSWGIPVPLPHAEGKVLYVWFDAPIGYISASMEWAQLKGDPDAWKRYWQDPETHMVQFIGKDNLTFHAVIFPAMCMGQTQSYKLVDELPANEFLQLEGRQFSKSDGWYIDMEDFLTRYTADQIRYTIAANAPETADAEFTWKDFQQRCNGDLVGKFGNLVHRVLTFTQTRAGAVIPAQGLLEAVDSEFLANIDRLTKEAEESYKNFRLRNASRLIMEIAQAGNVYFDTKTPWKDAKQPETHPRMLTTLGCCFECLKRLALIAAPLMPTASSKLWSMLGQTAELRSWREVCGLTLCVGQPLAAPATLFQPVLDEQIAEEVARLKRG